MNKIHNDNEEDDEGRLFTWAAVLVAAVSVFAWVFVP